MPTLLVIVFPTNRSTPYLAENAERETIQSRPLSRLRSGPAKAPTYRPAFVLHRPNMEKRHNG